MRHWDVRRTEKTQREGGRNLAGDKWKEVWTIGGVVRCNGRAVRRQLLKHDKEREKWCDEMQRGSGEVKVATQ